MNSKIEIHVFQCGQGDTIVLRLPNEKWALIDCNLAKGPIRDAFLSTLASWGVNRLDLICLTHPHDDHYNGLEAIIRHFTSENRSLGIFCDCGTEPKEVHTLLVRRQRPESVTREYESLYSIIIELINSGKLKYVRADENNIPVIKSGDARLMPIGPKAELAKVAVRNTIATGSIRADLNQLSVVLALTAGSNNNNFSALLAADADSVGIRSALISYKEKTDTQQVAFDFVKVSHHGSLHSHEGCGICDARNPSRESIAVVSCGLSDVLPDRKVLADFIAKNWTLLLTTKRLISRPQYAFEVSGSSAISTTVSQERNISVTWDGNQINWSPQEARVEASDLGNYQSASKN